MKSVDKPIKIKGKNVNSMKNLNPVKKMEIMCIYRSKKGREVEFNLLKDGSDTMDYEDLEVPNFVSMMGGFSVTMDGYKTVFRGVNFNHLWKPVSFLLESLFWLEGLSSGLLDIDGEFSSNLILSTTIEEKFVLSKSGENGLNLSFLAPDEAPMKTRAQHYFSEVPLPLKDWKEAVYIALEEYFYCAEQVLHQNPNGNNAGVLNELIDLWKKIMGIVQLELKNKE
jgi:hypothetical protein